MPSVRWSAVRVGGSFFYSNLGPEQPRLHGYPPWESERFAGHSVIIINHPEAMQPDFVPSASRAPWCLRYRPGHADCPGRLQSACITKAIFLITMAQFPESTPGSRKPEGPNGPSGPWWRPPCPWWRIPRVRGGRARRWGPAPSPGSARSPHQSILPAGFQSPG